MRNLLNTPELFVDQVLESLALANRARTPALKEESPTLISVPGNSGGRVTCATAARSRPSPFFVGYVARGLVDGCATRSPAPLPASTRPCHQPRATSGGHGPRDLSGVRQTLDNPPQGIVRLNRFSPTAIN